MSNDVDSAVETALSCGKPFEYEIAFFGGSFTAIDRQYMISLLKAAYKYVLSGKVKGIRLSTRPDAINEEVLTILREYGVTAVELGAQSMSEKVLTANLRGHTAEDVRNSSKLIKQFGFSLGLQMMTGLYGSTPETDLFTAKEIISLEPDTVRIYPTVILEGTRLGEFYKSGVYVPQSLEQSVELCAKLLKLFRQNNIEVIRLGLHYSEELKEKTLFNNYHPAFRELCESRIFIEEFLRLAKEKKLPLGQPLTVAVNPKSISKFLGQKKSNLTILKESGYNVTIKQDDTVKADTFLIL